MRLRPSSTKKRAKQGVKDIRRRSGGIYRRKTSSGLCSTGRRREGG